MYYSVDRIEECDFVVLISDDGEKHEVRSADIGFDVSEGDILTFENGKYSLSREEHDRRAEMLDDLLSELNIKNR